MTTQSSTGLKSTKPLAEAPTRVGHKTVEYSTRTAITDLHEILFFEINSSVSCPHGYYERLGSYLKLRWLDGGFLTNKLVVAGVPRGCYGIQVIFSVGDLTGRVIFRRQSFRTRKFPAAIFPDQLVSSGNLSRPTSFQRQFFPRRIFQRRFFRPLFFQTFVFSVGNPAFGKLSGNPETRTYNFFTFKKYILQYNLDLMFRF